MDTVSLFVTCVTVNNDTTDTLLPALDSLSGCSLALVRVHLSRFPVTLFPAACNMVEFNNHGNDRYVCHTCLKTVKCNKSDSLNFVTISKDVSYDSVFDSESGIMNVTPETKGIVELRVFRKTGLGSDSGSAVVRLHDLYNRVVSDSTEMDTSINLFWSE